MCLATSGPGATNLVTGIATAYMDSVPIVAITCNVDVPLLGKDSFQEIDIAGVTMPITKHNFIVKDVTKLAATIRRAFEIAQKAASGSGAGGYPEGCYGSRRRSMQSQDRADRASETGHDHGMRILQKALADDPKSGRKPYIFVGGGAVISGASARIKRICT